MTGERETGPGGAPRRMRVAEVFDGRGPTGGIVVDRPPVEPGEVPALTAYLTKAPVALATTKTGEDELSPGAGLVVPRAYHTDGEWIWPAAVGYYLHRYHLAPQTELLDHIRSRGYEIAPVPEEARQAAAAQMLETLAAAKRGAAPAAPVPPAPVAAAPVPAPAASPAAASAPPLEVKPAEASLWTPAPSPSSQDPAVPQVSQAPQMPQPEMPRVPRPAAPELAAPASSGSSFFEPAPKPATPAPAPEPVSAPAASPAPASAPASAPAGDSLAVPSFSGALTAAGNRHAAWVYEQIETFLDYMPLDEWSVDHGTRRYRQAGREFLVDALGRLGHDGRWIWAWAEAESWSKDPALTERSRLLRDEGDRLGIKELTAPVLDLSDNADADDPEIAAEMLVWTAMGVAGARGYIGHTLTDQGRIYYLAFDDEIPTAKPDVDGVLHFVSHGVAKFEEDATDCVLGYVEHYGWEWSRSEGGIVFSAGGLGSFTADVSEDGQFTGISLNE